MKKAFLLVLILFVSVISTACINNLAVQQLNNKAKGYLDKGDYANAISRLKSSIDLDSTIFETHYNLGIAYTQAEDYPDAVETLKNAIKLKPSFPDSYYSLAVAEENYAQGIIDGNLTNKLQPKEQNTQMEDEASTNTAKRTLTAEQKTQVAQLMNDAISSYSTYLEKSTKAQDKQDVEQKIASLKTKVAQYSSVPSP